MERQKSYRDPNQDNGTSAKFRPGAQQESNNQGWSFTKKKRFGIFFEKTTSKPAIISDEPIETRNRFSALQNIEEDIIEVKDKTVVHGECKGAQSKERKGMNMSVHEFPLEPQMKGRKQKVENSIGERKRNVVPGEYTYANTTERKGSDAKDNEVTLESPGQNYKEGSAASAATNRSRANPRLKDGTRFQKQSISIVGDLMLSKVRRQDHAREVPKYRINVKTFRGARVEHMYSYMEPTIEMGVDGVIILCGTNNLRDESSEVVAKKIVKLARHASNTVEQVAVSSIVRRTDSIELDQKRKK